MNYTLLKEFDFIPAKYITILKKQGIEKVYDLIHFYPHRFEDYTITLLKNVVCDEVVTINGIIVSKPTILNPKPNLSLMYFYIENNNITIKITIFNRHFLASKIKYGKYVRLTGKLNPDRKSFVCSLISFDELTSNINPVYNVDKIPDEKILLIKEKLIKLYENSFVDLLPKSILEKYDLISYKEAINYINNPIVMDDVTQALKRLKFEELLIYELKIQYLLYMRKKYPNGVSINYDEVKVNEFIKNLPYELTVDQKRSVEEILYDLKANYKMNRLLQGEVGSGKTVVSAISLYSVVTAGYQGAIMVPTEILAYQHYETFTKLFKNYNVKVSLLLSNIKANEKKLILSKIASKEIDIVIGTHALFQKDVNFSSLGLVITDEEHRFGVKQRVNLLNKGMFVDHLKMSATPIPRTLAISVLGESDISMIKTLPGKRKEPITKYIKGNETRIVFDHILEELNKNHQIYIVAPTIEYSDYMDLHDATNIYNKLVKYYEGICCVGLIHSKLKQEEKEEVMEKFKNNLIQILVSTTVIEVGVNVVNATTIVILDADRFGIAQLHQMRGRVRRSDEQSYCFLVSETESEVSIKRLVLLCNTNDGFILAEEDLKSRGVGDFFGDKQTGSINFRIASLETDTQLLEIAHEESKRIIENDIFKDEFKDLFEIVHSNYTNNLKMLD